MNKQQFNDYVEEMLSSNPFVDIGGDKYFVNDLLQRFNKLTILNGKELLKDTLKRKNSDYSGDNPFENFESCEKVLGITTLTGMKIRMLDKINRIKNLEDKAPEVVGESLADSILDLAGYIVLFNIYDKYIRNGYLH